MTLDGLLRIVMRRLFGRLLNRGIGMVSGRKGAGGARSPADRARARQSRDLAKRARKAARLTRRF
ncbi:MAG: hypothetical protein MUF73_06775 [Rhodobacteraceae bacterium]|jgi:hypothetical protein|nr:hypothetical protein [Paracoccaceae bacterium]